MKGPRICFWHALQTATLGPGWVRIPFPLMGRIDMDWPPFPPIPPPLPAPPDGADGAGVGANVGGGIETGADMIGGGIEIGADIDEGCGAAVIGGGIVCWTRGGGATGPGAGALPPAAGASKVLSGL